MAVCIAATIAFYTVVDKSGLQHAATIPYFEVVLATQGILYAGALSVIRGPGRDLGRLLALVGDRRPGDVRGVRSRPRRPPPRPRGVRRGGQGDERRHGHLGLAGDDLHEHVSARARDRCGARLRRRRRARALVRAVFAVVAAYAIGCLATGYYVVRILTGEDVRRHATGSSGARNVGRRAGLAAAAATLAADVAKGAVAVALAEAVAGEGAAAAALVAVVLGHAAPAQLGFRGGRGLGPALGGMLVLDPWGRRQLRLPWPSCAASSAGRSRPRGWSASRSAPIAALVLGEPRTALAAAAAGAVILAAHARGRPAARP